MAAEFDALPKKGYTKKQVRSLDLASTSGFYVESGTLDATTTTEIIKLGDPQKLVSMQTSGTLVATVTFSINGKDYFTGLSLTAGTPLTYSTHVVRFAKIVRTAGTGTCSVAAA